MLAIHTLSIKSSPGPFKTWSNELYLNMFWLPNSRAASSCIATANGIFVTRNKKLRKASSEHAKILFSTGCYISSRNK